MRFLKGLAPAFIAAAVCLVHGLPAIAQSATVYDLAPAPVASRGQIVEANGVRTYTADNGWYTMTLGPDDTTEVDNGIRFFTYGAAAMTNYVDVAISTDSIVDPEDELGLDVIQDTSAEMLAETPAFLDGITVTERKIIPLGGANGKKPLNLAVWIGTDAKAPGTVTVIGGSLLPKGSLMIMIDCNNAADAEAVLRKHLRLAEGVLE